MPDLIIFYKRQGTIMGINPNDRLANCEPAERYYANILI